MKSGKFCAWPRGVPLRNKGRQLSGEPAHGKWVPWQGLSRNSRLCTACVLHTGGKCVQGLLVALVERTRDREGWVVSKRWQSLEQKSMQCNTE